jgi:hypothetical protein
MILTVGSSPMQIPYIPFYILYHRISLAPHFAGLRRFPHGRHFKQWTGDDSKALMKVRELAISCSLALAYVPPRSISLRSRAMSPRKSFGVFMLSLTFAILHGRMCTPNNQFRALNVLLQTSSAIEKYSAQAVFAPMDLASPVNILWYIMPQIYGDLEPPMVFVPQSLNQNISRLSKSHGVDQTITKPSARCSSRISN